MAKRYQAYTTDFMEKAGEKGLRFTVMRLFTIIPAGIGHFIDTFLKLDGLFLDEDSHMGGPFGFLFGIVPFIVGTILGQALQIVFNVPSYTAYYLLDVPIGFFQGNHIEPFNKSMVNNPHLFAVNAVFTKVTAPTPTQMEGPFGFLAGIIPHSIRHGINRISGFAISIGDLIVDSLCDGVRFIYSSIGKLFSGKNQEKQAHDKQPKVGTKRPRIKRPVGTEVSSEQDDDLARVQKRKLNLFIVLGITREQYEANPDVARGQYKKLAKVLHPDKADKSTEEAVAQSNQKWQDLTDAKQILEDPRKKAIYLAAFTKDGYASGTSNPSIGKSVHSFHSTTTVRENETTRMARENDSARSGRPRFVRPSEPKVS